MVNRKPAKLTLNRLGIMCPNIIARLAVWDIISEMEYNFEVPKIKNFHFAKTMLYPL